MYHTTPRAYPHPRLLGASAAERMSVAACSTTDHMPREEALQMLEESCTGEECLVLASKMAGRSHVGPDPTLTCLRHLVNQGAMCFGPRCTTTGWRSDEGWAGPCSAACRH